MSILKKIYRNLPWKIVDQIDFYRVFGRLPNLREPKYFNEKVLYRKRHFCENNQFFTLLADKYAVRDYVSKLIGNEYLIPLYQKFESISEMKNITTEVNSSFVLKPNHGAGMVLLVDDFDPQKDLDNILSRAKEWLEKDFSRLHGEMHYAKIPRKILMEKRLGTKGDVLVDYKFHLFKNKNEKLFFVLQVIDGRFKGDLERTFYINNLNILHSGQHALSILEVKHLEKALCLSKILSGDLEYVRVDWYIHQDKLLFGEITLTPAAGLGSGYGDELDLLMGKEWTLPANGI